MMNDLAMASGMGDPLVPWIFEIVLPLIWLGIAAFHFSRTRRSGVLSLSALLFLGGTTMWWQEWYADWGAYLLFNYNFVQIPWGPTAWTAPSKPWAVIPSYGWYFGIVFALLVMLAERVKKARPSWSSLRATAVVVIPIFYLWDLAVEGSSAALGWFSYTNILGPALMTARGNFPLVWPILYFVFFAVMVVWLFVQKDVAGIWLHERLFGVHRMASGAKREFARFLVWSLTMNIMFWFVYNLPTCLLRVAFGGPSTLVP
ncbi:MAG: hypothetical protein FP814_00015 [Desulfobacterium sp.]|nr:hypothetical protein [Desulfobacterium sp.]MBU3948690.1 spirocyclase AveC family protein [Pseudomonadota bacterium]MBU4036897.1 spirocyclase AveC family protein [Pseudomonadota bacterium]